MSLTVPRVAQYKDYLAFFNPFFSKTIPVAAFFINDSITYQITDTADMEVGETKIFGRTDPIYIYGGTKRNINVSFSISDTIVVGQDGIRQSINSTQGQRLLSSAFPHYNSNRTLATPPVFLVNLPKRYDGMFYCYLDKVDVGTGNMIGPTRLVGADGSVAPFGNTITFNMKVMHLNTIDPGALFGENLINGDVIKFDE